MEFSPSRKRLLWRLLIAGIVVNALIFVWVGFGRGHGSTGTSERQVPPTYSPSPWLKYSRSLLSACASRPVSPGAPTMTAWVIDNRAALWQDLSRPAFIPANP